MKITHLSFLDDSTATILHCCNAYSSRKFLAEVVATSFATLDRTPKRKFENHVGSSPVSSTSVSASVSMLVSRDTSGLKVGICERNSLDGFISEEITYIHLVKNLSRQRKCGYGILLLHLQIQVWRRRRGRLGARSGLLWR